jgi:fumarate reductase (CoM/CoB) subunit A
VRNEVKNGTGSPNGGFYVDLSHSPYDRDVITEKLRSWLHQFSNLKNVGIDIRDDKVEMAPAAHYCLGGIKIDELGHTNIAGLFAAGEITGNVHGANRMSGNALSETQVFGRRAGLTACEYADQHPVVTGDFCTPVQEEYRLIAAWKQEKPNALRPIALKVRLQNVMDQFVGLERDGKSLLAGLVKIRELRAEELPKLSVVPHRRYCYEVQEAYEVRGMLDLAELVILSALSRKETRGHHFRVDYPQTDTVPYHTTIQWEKGEHTLGVMPVTRIDQREDVK